MLRRLEKGDGRDQPFSPGGAAYRPGADAGTDRRLSERGDEGNGGGGYQLVEVYEFFAAEYGWTARFIEANLTDEQFALYAEKAARRKGRQAFAELDRIVTGTSWGMAIAHDSKGRNARKWDRIRAKGLGDKRPQGLSGAALEQAVMAIASADPSLVKIQSGAR